MELVHLGKLSPAQLVILADRNVKTAEPLFESCPLCGITKPTDSSFQDHVVGHLRGLALQSLPLSYDTSAGDEEGFDSDEQGSGSQPSRSTIRNDRHRKCQPASNDTEPGRAVESFIASKYPRQVPPKFIEYTLWPDDDPLVKDLGKRGKLRPLGHPDRDENEIYYQLSTDYNSMWPSKAAERY